MEFYVKIFFISIFSLWFSNMILLDALILSVSQLPTQQVMTTLIRSHRDLDCKMRRICLVCIKYSLCDLINVVITLMMIREIGLLFGPPCILV